MGRLLFLLILGTAVGVLAGNWSTPLESELAPTVYSGPAVRNDFWSDRRAMEWRARVAVYGFAGAFLGLAIAAATGRTRSARTWAEE